MLRRDLREIYRSFSPDDARKEALQSQIQPHFVCNALCVIQDLAAEKAPEAAEAANDLSKFIRGNKN